MMGPQQKRDGKLFYAGFAIEERLGAEHPLRKIHAAIDFAFVRQEVADLYGIRGNPSLDPTLVLKLLFLLFYENVSSERELMRQLPCRLDWLWFLSMDLDSAIPDHSVLSKARKRWGSKVFAGFFKRVLEQCVAAGLVDGSRVHIDGSLIDAHADAKKLTLALEFTGEALYGQLEAAGEAAPTVATSTATPAAAAAATPAAASIAVVIPAAIPEATPAAIPEATPAAIPEVIPVAAPEVIPVATPEAPSVPASTTTSAIAATSSATAVENAAAPVTRRIGPATLPPTPPAPPPASPDPFTLPLPPASPAAVPPGTRYSKTDPDARLTRKYNHTVLGYKDHRVVDDRCGIITATITTAASIAESALLEKVMDQHESNTGLTIVEPTADKGYGTAQNYEMLYQRFCLPVIPHPAVREDKTKFPRTRFVYDPAQDVYRCPADQLLHRRGGVTDGRYRYQTLAGVCESCPLREKCTASKMRIISRQVHQATIEWADKLLSPHERKARMRRRKIRAEGSFADAATHHGYKRARWRGLEKMGIQNQMIAAIQNLRKLIKVRPPITGEGTGAARRHTSSGGGMGVALQRLCGHFVALFTNIFVETSH